MLQALTVTNFTVVKHLELSLKLGFSAVTGETGAGKSVTMDALSLCLGERADADKVRKGAEQAIVSCTFDISNLPAATRTLQHLGFEGDESELILRRIITSKGRSRAFINGHPATLTQMQQLGVHLASVCGQHAQYALLQADHQRMILDQYGKLAEPRSAVKEAHCDYTSLSEQYTTLLDAQSQREDRIQLLAYQVDELNEFSPEDGEFERLDQEQKRLSNGESLLTTAQTQLQRLSDGDQGTVLDGLQSAVRGLEDLLEQDETLTSIHNTLSSALAEAEDATQELRRYAEGIELDPARLAEVEQRFSAYMEFGRKHRIEPAQLAEHHFELDKELKSLNADSASLEDAKEAMELSLERYREVASSLHQHRTKAAKALSETITHYMPDMGMEHGECEVRVNKDESAIKENGFDSIAFHVRINPGETGGPLNKVSSGGELSRISLIVQLAIAQTHTTPTLVFDEVDVGISGPTAAAVGEMLRKLGNNTQVISITHLPQVASFGHQHFYVSKTQDDTQTCTHMVELEPADREKEIARLLGGKNGKQDATALANARKLISEGARQ